jgi:CrcB protein
MPAIATHHPEKNFAMSMYLWIALGSGLGGMGRYALTGLVAHHAGIAFPWGTFAVNVIGSFAIGFFSTLTGPDGRIFVDATGRQFFMTGVLGGFTTFSALSLQSLTLARNGEWLLSMANAIGSLATCLLAVTLGHLAAAAINSLKGS